MSTPTTRYGTLLVATAVVLAPALAAAQDESPTEEPPAAEEAPAEEAPAEETPVEEAPAEEAPVEETPVEETPVEETGEDDLGVDDDYVPGMEEATVPYDDQLPPEEDEEIDDGKPFAKGDIELGLGLGGYGSSDFFVLSIGGSFAYYVVNRLAPGIDINYMHVFSDDYEYPDSFTLLPFLKFVIIRSTKFAPYLVLAGGREFQWGGSSDPEKGVREADAWILGGGAGAHIGLGEHFALKIQLLALYYWYDNTKIIGVDDSWFDDTNNGETAAFVTDDGQPCDDGDPDCTGVYYKSQDRKDLSGELFFPLITIGFAVFF
jgi:hypothetical protein